MHDARDITLSLGGDWHGHSGNAPCPVCQAERRPDQRALSLRNQGGKLLAFCHKSGCDFQDIIKALGLPEDHLASSPAARHAEDAKRAAYERKQLARARGLWVRSQPLKATNGEVYLRGRKITCTLPPALRWVPKLSHGPSGRQLSAIVAAVSTGAVHRTFFEASGERVARCAKMMLGPCAGGAVPLSQEAGPLVVCEGIETGLSLASGLLGEPATIWAALSAPGMKALRLPRCPGRLIIATDGDDVGRQSGNVLARRARMSGWQVSMLPAPEGQDWNDVLRATKGAAA